MSLICTKNSFSIGQYEVFTCARVGKVPSVCKWGFLWPPLRYADDTTLMAESEEELKSLLMKVKVESEKVD